MTDPAKLSGVTARVIDLTTIDIIIIGKKSSGWPVCTLVFKSAQDLRQKGTNEVRQINAVL